MILHCWRCSLGGERPTKASEVAVINEQALNMPVNVSMFDRLPGAQADPFLGYEWRYMLHQACGSYPWPPQYVDVMDGPTKILTDDGLVDVCPVADIQNECPECGKSCKSKAGLLSHMRTKHGDPK